MLTYTPWGIISGEAPLLSFQIHILEVWRSGRFDGYVLGELDRIVGFISGICFHTWPTNMHNYVQFFSGPQMQQKWAQLASVTTIYIDQTLPSDSGKWWHNSITTYICGFPRCPWGTKGPYATFVTHEPSFLSIFSCFSQLSYEIHVYLFWCVFPRKKRV